MILVVMVGGLGSNPCNDGVRLTFHDWQTSIVIIHLESSIKQAVVALEEEEVLEHLFS